MNPPEMVTGQMTGHVTANPVTTPPPTGQRSEESPFRRPVTRPAVGQVTHPDRRSLTDPVDRPLTDRAAHAAGHHAADRPPMPGQYPHRPAQTPLTGQPLTGHGQRHGHVEHGRLRRVFDRLTGQPDGQPDRGTVNSHKPPVNGQPVNGQAPGRPVIHPYPVTDRPTGSGRPVNPDRSTPTGQSPEQSPNATVTPVGKPFKIAMAVLLWVVCGIAAFIAGLGQVEHARKLGVTDWTMFLFPVSFEGVSYLFAGIGYLQARRRETPWPFWSASIGFGLWAVKMQLDNAGPVGALFATTSVASVVLLIVKAYIEASAHLKDVGLDRITMWQWVAAPRLTRRAKLLHWRKVPYKTTARLYELASAWNHLYDQVRTLLTQQEVKRSGKLRWADKRLIKKRAYAAATRQVQAMAGMSVPEIPDTLVLHELSSVVARPQTPVGDRSPRPVTGQNAAGLGLTGDRSEQQPVNGQTVDRPVSSGQPVDGHPGHPGGQEPVIGQPGRSPADVADRPATEPKRRPAPTPRPDVDDAAAAFEPELSILKKAWPLWREPNFSQSGDKISAMLKQVKNQHPDGAYNALRCSKGTAMKLQAVLDFQAGRVSAAELNNCKALTPAEIERLTR